MKSTLLICIKKQNNINQDNFITIEYITNTYIITHTPTIEILYRKGDESLYKIDNISKKLFPISLDEQKNNMDNIRNMIEIFDVFNKDGNVIIEGKGQNISLNGKIEIAKNNHLKNSVFLDYYDFSKRTSILDISLEECQFIKKAT